MQRGFVGVMGGADRLKLLLDKAAMLQFLKVRRYDCCRHAVAGVGSTHAHAFLLRITCTFSSVRQSPRQNHQADVSLPVLFGSDGHVSSPDAIR